MLCLLEKTNANKCHLWVTNILDVACQSPDIPGDSLLQQTYLINVGRVSGIFEFQFQFAFEKNGLFPHTQNGKAYNCVLRQSISVDKNGSNGN